MTFPRALALLAASVVSSGWCAACTHEGSDSPPSHVVPVTADAATKMADREAGVATDSSLFGVPARPVDLPAEAAPRCEDAKDVFLFVTPGTAWTGAPLRILAVSDPEQHQVLRGGHCRGIRDPSGHR